jgi:hypothetical protein
VIPVAASMTMSALATALFLALAASPAGDAPAPSPPASAPARLRLVFHGNVVLPEEVYLAILNLPPDAPATEATAAEVRDTLTHFLQRAGYELAAVGVALAGDELHVAIDEGRLGKIILPGQGAWGAFEANIDLELPHKVFNRPAVERLVQRIGSRFDVRVESFELVPSTEVEHFGPQIQTLGPVEGVVQTVFGKPLIPPHSRYDLVIVSHRNEWAHGFHVGAGLSGADGFLARGEYLGEGLLWDRDRWIARAEVGAKVRSRLITDQAAFSFTRGALELGWRGPPLEWHGWKLRPSLDLGASYLSRQRPDLPLESYQRTLVQSVASLRIEPRPGLELSLGAGIERIDVFGLQPAYGLSIPGGVAPIGLTHALVQAGADIVFDPGEIRRDRRHELHLEAQLHPASARSHYEVVRWNYQKVFGYGWHDLLIGSRGAFFWGEPPFTEEMSVGGALVRGVFPDQLYTRRAASLNLEARISLVRDLYKVAIFHDLAVFQERDRVGHTTRPRFANSFGLGLTALIADAFQVGVYYSVGFTNATSPAASGGGRFSHGITVGLKEAF